MGQYYMYLTGNVANLISLSPLPNSDSQTHELMAELKILRENLCGMKEYVEIMTEYMNHVNFTSEFRAIPSPD